MAKDKAKKTGPAEQDRLEEAIRYLAAQTGNQDPVEQILTAERKAGKAAEEGGAGTES